MTDLYDEGYSQGYANGKSKAHDELRHHEDDHHGVSTCGCENCQTFRAIMQPVMQRLIQGLPHALALDMAKEMAKQGYEVTPDSN